MDYRGPLIATFIPIPVGIFDSKTNQTEFKIEAFPYEVGDRVCQIEVYKRKNITFEEVSELSETERGAEGFGSTGLK